MDTEAQLKVDMFSTTKEHRNKYSDTPNNVLSNISSLIFIRERHIVMPGSLFFPRVYLNHIHLLKEKMNLLFSV